MDIHSEFKSRAIHLLDGLDEAPNAIILTAKIRGMSKNELVAELLDQIVLAVLRERGMEPSEN
jgi:hypothetical protein